MAGHFGYFPIDDGRLVAYDLDRGTLRWAVAATAVSRPAVGNGLVYVLEADAISALVEADGVVKWRVPFSEPLSVPLLWDSGWLVAATVSGTVLAFRADDGRLMWRHEIAGGIRAEPAIADDRVYLSTQMGQVIALQVATGKRVWERRVGGQPNDILALRDRIYVGSTDNFLYALGARSGDINWRWATGGDVVGLPVADADRLYFVSYDNILRALDRKSGAQRWKRALALRPTRGPVLTEATLIVSGVSRTAPAFLVKDGAPAGDIAGGGELITPPHPLSAAGVPTVIIVTRDFTDGTVIKALRRNYDPPVAPISPLQNLTPPEVPAGILPARAPNTPNTPNRGPSDPRQGLPPIAPPR